MTTAPIEPPCPVCRASGDDPCRGVDFLPLPSSHAERSDATPMYDELLARVK